MFSLPLFRLLSRRNLPLRAQHIAAATQNVTRLSKNHNTLNTTSRRNLHNIRHCRHITSAAVRKSDHFPSNFGSLEKPHDSDPVERNLENPLLGHTSPWAEEYRIAIETLAAENDLAGCVAALAQLQVKEVPCTREMYMTFLQAVLHYPDTDGQDPWNVAAFLVEQAGIEGREAQRRGIPEGLLLDNRQGMDAKTAWKRYDAYLSVNELRQLLFDIAIPTQRETAELVLRILNDISEAVPEWRRRAAEPTPLFDNHERLQQIYAHGVLGNRDEMESTFMKLWDQAPGLEMELPFHLLADSGYEANPLKAVSTAFLVFIEMEARGTRWSMEIFLILISSLWRARQHAPPGTVLANLTQAVDDAVRRRDVNIVMSRIHGWGLGYEYEGVDTMAEGERTGLENISYSDRPLPIDNRLAARKYAATVKSYIETGVWNHTQLSQILSGLDILFAKHTKQDPDDTARLILNISSTLSANNQALTLDEKGRQMSAWAHFGQWEMILKGVPEEMATVPVGHIDYRHLLTLYLLALCRSDYVNDAFDILFELDRQKKMHIKFLDVMLNSFVGKDALINIWRIYFEIIPQSELECTPNTYAHAISAFCQQQCPSIAEKVFKDMLTANVPPQRFMFRTLTRGYAATDKLMMGIEALKRMEEYGFKREVEDYAVYFRQLVKDAADLIFVDHAKPLSPSHLKATLKMETVLKVYQDMMKEGPLPDAYCTEKAIAACFFLRNTPSVDEIFRYARFHSISLTPESYHWLVNWNVQIYNREGIRNLVMMAEQEKVSLSKHTHSLVIKAYCRENTENAINYYEMLRREKKLKLDDIMVVQLFGILRSQGKWDMVDDLLQELREMRYIMPPKALTRAAKSIYQRSGAIINAVALINAMRSIGAHIELETYEFLLWRFMDHACRYFPEGVKTHIPKVTPVKIQPEQAASMMKVLFEDMLKQNLEPTRFIYRLMILSLSAVREVNAAMEIVRLARNAQVSLDDDTEAVILALQDCIKAPRQGNDPILSSKKLDQELANNRHLIDLEEEVEEMDTEPSAKERKQLAVAERDGRKLDEWDWGGSSIEEDPQLGTNKGGWKVR